MKSNSLLQFAGVFALSAALSGSALFAAEESETVLMKEAKVSKADATKTALAKVPGGKIKTTELEKENGKLVWSFDIATEGSPNITEVQVNAVTGKIAAVESETPAQQKKEAAEDKAKKEKK